MMWDISFVVVFFLIGWLSWGAMPIVSVISIAIGGLWVVLAFEGWLRPLE